ncbi:MAG: translation initiation factor IF-2 subunit gamma [Candidatus Micrarchaeota archaeon]|nr:translation initiation factor IF-2 subunit gamma [Candidatus Micrarchaeota archaeon]
MAQAEVNIGMLGHVDHGKTSITKILTGVWTDTHSEELKRGITIKLGYADAIFRKCEKCEGSDSYTVEEKCPKCGGPAKILRKVSFLDAPGHETLMTTAIAASSIMDGAVLVIAANEPCPQAQTFEHLTILKILGIQKVVVVQNKIDLASREKVRENYNQIREFLSKNGFQNAPIIPFIANYGINCELLIEAIENTIPTPKRDLESSPRMYVARSFDVNKPGADIGGLVGGVVGGSLITGRLKVGDEVELRPGTSAGEKSEVIKPVFARVEVLSTGKERLQEAVPGGLIAIGTKLDPSITKSDGLVGNLLGIAGGLPEVRSEISVAWKLIDRVDIENPPFRQDEPLVISIGTSTSVGFVTKIKKDTMVLKMKRTICAEKGSKLAISRRIGQRWRLAGFGELKD